MARYRELSERVFEIYQRFTPLVEPLSIDEAFLDVTASTRLFGDPVEIARRIKALVVGQTGLTVSAGVAPSKFVAKIASDLEKPDGLTVVPPGAVRMFLSPLPVERMWGVGRATREVMSRLGIRTFEDLSRMPPETAEHHFGRHGVHMRLLALGIDEREVEPLHRMKSLGHEETFARDLTSLDEARRELLALAVRVARRLRGHGASGRTVTLKVKYADFRLITRSESLPAGTDDAREIFRTVCGLLPKTAVGRKPVRLLGIALSQLNLTGEGLQLGLFEEQTGLRRTRQLNRALDRVWDRFGDKALAPAALYLKGREEEQD